MKSLLLASLALLTVLPFQLRQMGPELLCRVGDRGGMVGVGRTRRQRLLESLSRCRFPLGKVLPEQPVEGPHQAVAIRRERAEAHVTVAVLGAGAQTAHRVQQLAFDPGGVSLYWLGRGR